MTETRKTKTTKTLTASELAARLAGVVGRHSAIGKRARDMAATHYAAKTPEEVRK